MLRILRRVALWRDRMLTLQVCMVLAFLTAATAYTCYLLSLLPWPLIWEWTFRLLGVAAFGPHMILVGRHVEALQADWKRQCAEFKEAGSDEREAICETHKRRLIAERRVWYDQPDPDAPPPEAGDETAAGSEDPMLKRDGSLSVTSTGAANYFNMTMRPNPTAGTLKFRHKTSKKQRHRAYPLDPADPLAYEDVSQPVPLEA